VQAHYERIDTELALLDSLRSSSKDYGEMATSLQMVAIRLTFEQYGLSECRIPVLRFICRYEEDFLSSKQLKRIDAHGIIEWLFNGLPPGKDTPIDPKALLALHSIKILHETEKLNYSDESSLQKSPAKISALERKASKYKDWLFASL
jgi:hypothetical protein|tara:strand:- start:1322 stop:1765 length:444 start_codon:yes stop_codon:yes gene_type:complete